MKVEMYVDGTCQTLTTKFETEIWGNSNSNEYILTFQAQQPLAVKQIDENTVQLVVTGDWEMSDLLETMSTVCGIKVFKLLESVQSCSLKSICGPEENQDGSQT